MMLTERLRRPLYWSMYFCTVSLYGISITLGRRCRRLMYTSGGKVGFSPVVSQLSSKATKLRMFHS